jgi:hypothetical protein
MKNLILGVALIVAPLAGAQTNNQPCWHDCDQPIDQRTKVTVIDRQESSQDYSYVFINKITGVSEDMTLRGATLTLLLPNGDTTVVNCVSKFQERFAGPGNVRSCRIPLVNEFEAIFHGDKAKLFWSVSLDGSKVASETYKILAVSKAVAGSK